MVLPLPPLCDLDPAAGLPALTESPVTARVVHRRMSGWFEVTCSGREGRTQGGSAWGGMGTHPEQRTEAPIRARRNSSVALASCAAPSALAAALSPWTANGAGLGLPGWGLAGVVAMLAHACPYQSRKHNRTFKLRSPLSSSVGGVDALPFGTLPISIFQNVLAAHSYLIRDGHFELFKLPWVCIQLLNSI